MAAISIIHKDNCIYLPYNVSSNGFISGLRKEGDVSFTPPLHNQQDGRCLVVLYYICLVCEKHTEVARGEIQFNSEEQWLSIVRPCMLIGTMIQVYIDQWTMAEQWIGQNSI